MEVLSAKCEVRCLERAETGLGPLDGGCMSALLCRAFSLCLVLSQIVDRRAKVRAFSLSSLYYGALRCAEYDIYPRESADGVPMAESTCLPDGAVEAALWGFYGAGQARLCEVFAVRCCLRCAVQCSTMRGRVLWMDGMDG